MFHLAIMRVRAHVEVTHLFKPLHLLIELYHTALSGYNCCHTERVWRRPRGRTRNRSEQKIR